MKYRLCEVKNAVWDDTLRLAKFHCWSTTIIKQTQYVVAIIEYLDGTVAAVVPERIKFIQKTFEGD